MPTTDFLHRDPEQDQFFVFVYGSLLPGLHNHILIQHADCLGDGEIPGVLFSLGTFPALVPLKFFQDKTLKNMVHGKVYAVDSDTLSDLDTLEGYTPGAHNNLYDRELVPVRMHDGSTKGAFVYQASYQIVRDISRGGYPPVPDGKWGAFAQKYVVSNMRKARRF
jgi:gamma-glutamylcyclotransferase (GGCT)/AIG2-like uncharacterized protein YtfP